MKAMLWSLRNHHLRNFCGYYWYFVAVAVIAVAILRFLGRLFRSSTVVEIIGRDRAALHRKDGIEHAERVNGVWIYRDETGFLDGDAVGWSLSRRLTREHAKQFGDLPSMRVKR